MNEWMNECMREWMKAWMNESMNEQWINAWMYWKNKWKMNECMNVRINNRYFFFARGISNSRPTWMNEWLIEWGMNLWINVNLFIVACIFNCHPVPLFEWRHWIIDERLLQNKFRLYFLLYILQFVFERNTIDSLWP